MILLTDMAAVLRAGGCTVVEVDGWKSRSYAGYAGVGYNFRPTHVMVHHTASKTTPANDIAYQLLGAPNPTPGRPRLAPIGNMLLDRDGVFHVIAAGRAVTNGVGSSKPWNGGVPDDMMNHYSIAIEAANSGLGEVWPTAQCTAYVKGVAALCRGYGIPVEHVRAHHEWSPGRKIDPAGPTPSHPTWGGVTAVSSWTMPYFRQDVANAVAALNARPEQAPVPQHNFLVEDNMLVINPPKRAYDSRQTGGVLDGGVTRKINVKPIVGTAKAAMINVAAVAPAASGYLVAWGEGPKPLASSVNFTKAENIQNAIVVPIAPDGTIQVWSSQDCHLVLDVQATWA